MDKKDFQISDILGFAWNTTIKNIWFFVGVFLIFLFFSYLPTVAQLILQHIRPPQPIYGILYVSFMVIGWIISIAINIGVIRIMLSFIDGQKPAVSTLFDAGGVFWKYLGTVILYGLIVIGGLLLFIVPGIIWAVKFLFAQWIVVDTGCGPIEALKRSSAATYGLKWQILGFYVICVLIIYAGFFALLVGAFVTMPIFFLALALLYRQLSAQTFKLQLTA